MNYQVSESYTWKSLKEGVVILNLSDGAYFTLNDTASHIWKNMVEGLSIEEIAQSLQSEFDCSKDESLEDVESYISSCLEEGIICSKTEGI